MQTQRTNRCRHHPRIRLALRHFLVRVTNPQPASKIQILQRNSRTPQFTHIALQSPQRPLEWPQSHNLRADVHADSLPPNVPRIAMSQIQPPRLLPIQPKFVFVAPRRNVRVTTSLDVRIHANRNGRRLASTSPLARRLIYQRCKLCLRLDIEKQSPTLATTP